MGLPPPFWAFAWAGGQALARYALDNPGAGQRQAGARFRFRLGACRDRGGQGRRGQRPRPPTSTPSPSPRSRPTPPRTVSPSRPRLENLIGADEGWEVVLAGDIAYEKDFADAAMDWLASLARRGATVLIGDPRRSYLPLDRLDCVIEYSVPVTRELEDSEIKRTGRIPLSVTLAFSLNSTAAGLIVLANMILARSERFALLMSELSVLDEEFFHARFTHRPHCSRAGDPIRRLCAAGWTGWGQGRSQISSTSPTQASALRLDCAAVWGCPCNRAIPPATSGAVTPGQVVPQNVQVTPRAGGTGDRPSLTVTACSSIPRTASCGSSISGAGERRRLATCLRKARRPALAELVGRTADPCSVRWLSLYGHMLPFKCISGRRSFAEASDRSFP